MSVDLATRLNTRARCDVCDKPVTHTSQFDFNGYDLVCELCLCNTCRMPSRPFALTVLDNVYRVVCGCNDTEGFDIPAYQTPVGKSQRPSLSVLVPAIVPHSAAPVTSTPARDAAAARDAMVPVAEVAPAVAPQQSTQAQSVPEKHQNVPAVALKIDPVANERVQHETATTSAQYPVDPNQGETDNNGSDSFPKPSPATVIPEASNTPPLQSDITKSPAHDQEASNSVVGSIVNDVVDELHEPPHASHDVPPQSEAPSGTIASTLNQPNRSSSTLELSSGDGDSDKAPEEAAAPASSTPQQSATQNGSTQATSIDVDLPTQTPVDIEKFATPDLLLQDEQGHAIVPEVATALATSAGATLSVPQPLGSNLSLASTIPDDTSSSMFVSSNEDALEDDDEEDEDDDDDDTVIGDQEPDLSSTQDSDSLSVARSSSAKSNSSQDRKERLKGKTQKLKGEVEKELAETRAKNQKRKVKVDAKTNKRLAAVAEKKLQLEADVAVAMAETELARQELEAAMARKEAERQKRHTQLEVLDAQREEERIKQRMALDALRAKEDEEAMIRLADRRRAEQEADASRRRAEAERREAEQGSETTFLNQTPTSFFLRALLYRVVVFSKTGPKLESNPVFSLFCCNSSHTC
jgi:hypothetical protein